MYRRFIIGMFLILGFLGLAGQTVLEIAAPGILNMPAVASNNNLISFQYNLRNISSTAFSGTVHTMALVNGTLILPLDSVLVNTLNPNQITHVSVTNFAVSSSTLPFVLGRNGIVIWVADDNFHPLTDSLSQEIFLLDRPAFRVEPLSLPCPLSVTPNERLNLSVRVVNEFEDLYNDTLSLHVSANGRYLGALVSKGKFAVPGNGRSSFEMMGFKFEAGDFPVGNNHLRLWATGLQGAWSLDTLECIVKVFPESTTGISEEDGFSVYPNPSQGGFNVAGALPAGARMCLRDALGRTLLELEAQPSLDLRSMSLAAGTYWLALFDRESGRLANIKVVLLP